MSILLEIEFDREKFKLGKLCRRGHDWNGTGQSLRYVKNAQCDGCRRVYEAANKERLKLLRQQWRLDNPDRTVELAREGYLRNKETVLERSHKRYQENREAILIQTAAYQKAHPEQTREKGRRWANRNPEKVKEKTRRQKLRNPGRSAVYYQANKERIQERSKQHYQLNKDKTLARKQRRRARKANATTISPTALETRLLIERCHHKCVYCDSDRDLALEHFISLHTGGTDCIGNLVIACKTCNSSKGVKDPYQWFQTRLTFSTKRWKGILRLLGKTQATYNQIPLL